VHAGELNERIGRRLKAARTQGGMSLGDLADAAGVSKSILSRIERGDGNPSIETLWRVARALDVGLGALIGEDDAPRERSVRARTGARVDAEHDAMAGYLLHADGRPKRSEIFEIEMPPHADRTSEAHQAGTEEVIFCFAGSLRVGPAGEEVELATGDAAWFTADRPHRYAAGPAGAQVVNLMLYPAGGLT